MTNLAQYRGWSSRIRRRAAIATLALAVVLAQVVIAIPSAEAQADTTFEVLYSFKGGTDGAAPNAGLLRGGGGNLYGTTFTGGTASRGTVFKLDTTGNLTILHSFLGGATDGIGPVASLVRDAAGNLYGTTYSGGTSDFGTVFKLDTTGTETVLYNFQGKDGTYPAAGLRRDAAGNLYGTTSGAGHAGGGTVFKLDTTGTETVLHLFTGADGDSPYAGLVRDTAGNLYGTTLYGGASHNCTLRCGTVFKLDTAGKLTVLHSFTGGADGQYPQAGLIRDAAGNLYGTTVRGGALDCDPPYGCGTVFKLDTTGTETVLYSFTGQPDGKWPIAGLFRDAAGNLYGTANAGGSGQCFGGLGCGTVFKLDTAGKLTVLHSFLGPDGVSPLASLVRDAAGNLYGTTQYGGAFGLGTVFRISH